MTGTAYSTSHLPDGGELRTLRDAGRSIAALPRGDARAARMEVVKRLLDVLFSEKSNLSGTVGALANFYAGALS